MLTALTLEDFKSFRLASMELAPMTLLVGANASGKSNVFDAIRFLQGVGLGLPLVDILRGRTEGGRQVWPGIRGGAAEIARHGAHAFGVTSRWKIGMEELEHEVSSWGANPYLREERLGRVGKESLCRTLGPVPEDSWAYFLPVEYIPAEGEAATNVGIDGSASMLSRITGFEHVHPDVLHACSATRGAMSNILFLDINPWRMRDYVPKSSTQLGSEGQNVSAMVWRLCQDDARKQDLLDWMSELCAPELAGIDFVETELGDVMLVLIEKDGARVSARSLSDGTLRFLGELTALLTAPPDSLILIEEIENGLHPARVHLLVELLTGLTAERGIQILATTHSPQVLGALADIDAELASSALVFGRIPDEAGTVVRRLGDLPHFDEVRQRRSMEHLFTTQWLERAL
ncbi:MAG: AAA family ATPase [Nannocystaceae bacterium]